MTVASASKTTTEHAHASADARSLETAATAATAPPRRWTATYVRRLVYTDAVAIVIAVTVAQLVRFGSTDATLSSLGSELSYTAVSVLLAVGWIGALAIFHTHDVRVIGSGAEEYRRVAQASLTLFGGVAIVAFLANQQLARGYIAVALPAGLTTLSVGRWLWRRWLLRRRMAGECTSTVLVVGSHRSALAMAKTFESDVVAGYRVVGVCVPGTSRPQGELLNVDGHAVPVLGDEHAVLQALEFTGADTVAVSNTDSLGTEGMRALAWDLDAVDVDLVVSAGLLDVAGPRLKIRPVAGLPLLHVEKPQYEG
ncbi:MAG: sugar transferase, partial [Mycobacteriaceae bacterium]